MTAQTVRTTGRYAYRDYVIDGVASSGDNEPVKSESREFVDATADAIEVLELNQSTGGVVFTTKAQADTRLDYAAYTRAEIYDDPDEELNGVYQKQGATGFGSWLKISDLAVSVLSADLETQTERIDTIVGELRLDPVQASVMIGSGAGVTAVGAGATLYGASAGALLTTAIDIVAVGFNALAAVTTGDSNTGVGKNAGVGAIGASTNNVFVGYNAGGTYGAGGVVDDTTAVGTEAGLNASGHRCVYLGRGAGVGMTLDDYLVVDNQARASEAAVLTNSLLVGKFETDREDQWLKVNGVLFALDGKVEMLDGQGNGSQGNISIGVGLDSVISGNSNTRIGYKAGKSLTTGIGNTFIGENAGKDVTTGINNTAIGWDSQFVNITGQNNTSLGEDALKYVTGNGNTGVGYTAGYSISTGLENCAYGPLSLYNVTTGDYNCAYGWGSGDGLATDSSRNVLIGYSTYKTAAAVVNDNTVVGYAAGREAIGSRNIFLGMGAGYSETNSDRFIVSNAIAAGPTTALLYGVMHGTPTPASQSLTVNGHLYGNNATVIGWPDAPFARDAAAQVGVRNGATAQSLAVYNTWTSSTVFERYRARWSSNVLQIGTEAGGSGGTARRVEHTTSINDGWAVRTSVDNTYTKIGGFEAPSLTAGRNAYFEVGVAALGVNAGVINFSYVGAANTANFLGLGFYSGLNILNVVATQRVGIKETSPDYVLDVNGTFGFTPGAAVTPVDNGDIVFEFTNNTTLTIKGKGSDGTVRSVALTLAP